MPEVRKAARRVLSTRVSVAAVLEAAAWLSIPYVMVGLVWAFFHVEEVQQVENLLQGRIPAGADVVAYLVVAGFWPAYLVVPALCAA